MLFQLIAGVFLYSPTNNAEASYNDSWYNTSWSYRKSITIDHNKVPHTDTNNANAYLFDFPVLISITDDPALKFAPEGKVQKADGSDIIFTLPDKTLLNYEIESYDKDTGKLVAWVKVPKLYDASNPANAVVLDTVIYMYYGNASAPANTTAASVWDSNFKMVQHMNQDSSGTAPQFIDSTNNTNNGTSSAGMASNDPISGKIDGANSFDGTDDEISAGTNDLGVSNAITLEAWIKVNSKTENAYAGIVGKYRNNRDIESGGGCGTDYSLSLSYAGVKPDFFVTTSGGNACQQFQSNTTLSLNTWYHFVGTYDAGTGSAKIYLNGSQNASANYTGQILSSAYPIKIGRVVGNYFSGSLDEVRISSTARSADWIQTEYNNQSSPSDFLTLGLEENTSSPYLTEGTPVSTPTINSAPSYTFDSTKPGTITYGGDCSSATTSAVAGNNTVSFNTLSAGLHSNCTIQVKNAIGNSNILPVTSFTVNTNLTTYVVPAITDNKILPKSTIDSSYLSDTISAQASPSEYKALSFVVNSNVDIADLQVEASDLTGNRNTIASANVDIKAVKCWYQGNYTTNLSVQGRYLTPELLLKDDSLVNVTEDDWNRSNVSNPDGKNYLNINGSYTDISDGTQTNGNFVITPISSRPIQDASTLQPINLSASYNKQFWITLYVPDAAVAGDYSGSITLKNSNETIKTLNLDLKVLPINLLEPSIEYSILYRGTIKGEGSISSENKTVEQYTAEQQDMKDHGITTPTIYPFGTNDNLIQELSIRRQIGMDNTNMYSVGGIATNNISTYKDLTSSYGVVNFFQFGPDESGFNDSEYRTIIENTHSAGGKAFGGATVPQADAAADIFDLAIVSGSLSSDLAAKYHSYGHTVYSYANPQIVPEYPYTFRKNYGLSLWQADYDGAMDYAYQHSFGDIWNDFDSSSYRDHVFAYPTANAVIDTIQWEGFREGINDMRYLAALQSAIAVAKAKGTNTTITEAENYLATLKSSNLANQDLDTVRSKMIDYLLALQSASYSLSIDQGAPSGFYAKDTRVNISANSPQSGMMFDKWTGDIQYVSDINSATTTVVMPAHAITLTATYKNNAPWYNANCLYREAITIDHDKIPNTNQTDFPVLVSLNDANLKDIASGGKVQNANGYDIVFTLPDGTPLKYEIESYDNTTGKLIAWVRVPTLSTATDTAVYMYYDNAAISDSQENKTSVWDTNFKMVQHMNQDSSGTAPQFIDSTNNTNNGTSSAGMASNDPISGKIDGANSFDGTDDEISAGTNDLSVSNAITLEAWIKVNSKTENAYAGIVGKYRNNRDIESGGGCGNDYSLSLSYAGVKPDFFVTTSGGNACQQFQSNTTLSLNTWYHFVGTYDAGTGSAKIYLNGSQNASANYAGQILSSAYPIKIGQVINNLSVNFFNGSLDEVRISSTARSADWIKTEYNNQSDPSSFYATSPQESYLDHYIITGNNTQESSKSQTLTLTAYTYSGNTYTAYTGDKTITLTGANPYLSNYPTFTDKNGNETDFGSYATVSFTNGIAHTNITLYKAETANIIATDGYCNNTPSLQVSIPNNSAFIPPSKPSLTNINITTDNNHLTLTNLPNNITQIAISTSPDFTNSSWEDISKKDEIIQQYTNADTLYIKFRTQDGASSDTVILKGNNIDIINDTDSNLTLQDGDIVKTPNNPDIYVIKYKNNKQYKRLLLSPTIFNSYLHLKWNNIKTISQQQLDQYQTSNLVKETTDTIIYQLFPNNDTGKRKPLNPSTSYDPDSIYEINKPERDSYELED